MSKKLKPLKSFKKEEVMSEKKHELINLYQAKDGNAKSNKNALEDMNSIPNNDSKTQLIYVFIFLALLLILPLVLDGFGGIKIGFIMFLGPVFAIIVLAVVSNFIKG